MPGSPRQHRFVSRIALPFLVATLAFVVATSHTAADETSAHRLNDIAVDAYAYAYPMVLMEITRRVSTNVEAPRGPFAPMNRFAHLRAFPDHTFREVVRPNADTLYSVLWFDVSVEPIVISKPDTAGRYHMLPMLDMWTDVFAAPGSRTTGDGEGAFAIVGPRWDGTLPDGVEAIRSPTCFGWVIGRTRTDGPSDYANVRRIQDGIKATPLSAWGKAYVPPDRVAVQSGWDMKTPPPTQVAKMDAPTFFGLFAELLKSNPPHEMDWNMVVLLRRIGIVPGQAFDFSGLPAATRRALELAIPEAQELIASHRAGEIVRGWSIARSLMGSYGTSYTHRAHVAMIGLGANLPEDAVYPMSATTAEGLPYHGRNRYVLHFDKDELPPVNGFWSLAMYDSSGYFVDNPIRRYSIGDRDTLRYNDDGSLDLYVQHESPGKAREANWLPAPAAKFNVVLRLYWPRTPILTGEWMPPPLYGSAFRRTTELPR